MRIVIGILLVAITSMAYANEAAVEHDGSQPVNITAQRLDANDKTGVFIFKGDVQAQQGDAFIYAQKMTVYYSKVQDKRQVSEVVAEEDVRIVQLDRVATGEKAVFDNQQGKIVLTGNPQVVQGDNRVAGEKIIVYLNDHRSIVEGGSEQRVKAVFVPGERK